MTFRLAVSVLACFAVSCASVAPGAFCASDVDAFVRLYGSRFSIRTGLVLGDLSESPCSTFYLSERQVRYFFLHARQVSAYSMGQEYAWYPCDQEGTIRVKGREFVWNISPAGTAAIFQGNKVLFYLACDCYKGCLEVFPSGGNMYHDPPRR